MFGQGNTERLKKKRSLGPSEPPSPTLSAVHASGVSTPIPKTNISGSSATTPTSSVILKRSISAADVKASPKAVSEPSRKPSKPDLKALNNEEIRSYSPWYIRSWPRGKSVAVTKVAPENIERESPPPTPPEAETTTFAPPRDSDTAVQAETVNLDSAPPEIGANSVEGLTGPQVITSTAVQPPYALKAPTAQQEPLERVVPDKTNNSANSASPTDITDNQSTAPLAASWIGWLWSAPPPQKTIVTEGPENLDTKDQEPNSVESRYEPVETTQPLPTAEFPTVPSLGVSTTIVNGNVGKGEPSTTQSAQQSSSWLGWWGAPPAPEPTKGEAAEIAATKSTSQGLVVENEPGTNSVPTQTAQASETLLTLQKDVQVSAFEPQAAASKQASNVEATNVRGSTWAFWYRSQPATKQEEESISSVVGEVAVAETPSQSEPQAVKIDKLPAVTSKQSSQAGGKVDKSTIGSGDEGTKNVASSQKDKGVLTPTTTASTSNTAGASLPSPAKHKLQKICPPNHLFPSFESCYHRLETPSALCKFTKIFRLSQPEPRKKHLYLAPSPPKIKKAVAIGVHGFFPMRLVRTVLGEPTGTSVRFAEAAAAAIKRWAEANGMEIEIEKVALEGEGKVADRVETLWKLLENWMDHVKSADFVLIAAHSQGVVVGIQLLARMIEEGCVDEARVGFAAMAGINLGPFYHLPTSILTGAAKELFEFQKSESNVSKKYIQALRTVLAHHVRLLFVGSIDDQLVPLESSTFSNIHHPYIFRAVFIDGRVHAPDFLSHLVGFAMKLRNVGISDHGLIRELSGPLAGSLYNGEGHSRIYDDNAVYDLAVRHSLETTECPDVPLRADPFVLPASNNNPFFLPWSMRGLLEEPYVRTRLEAEKNELLKQFENWHPVSKPLKDVKFRLDAIRSRL